MNMPSMDCPLQWSESKAQLVDLHGPSRAHSSLICQVQLNTSVQCVYDLTTFTYYLILTCRRLALIVRPDLEF